MLQPKATTTVVSDGLADGLLCLLSLCGHLPHILFETERRFLQLDAPRADGRSVRFRLALEVHFLLGGG